MPDWQKLRMAPVIARRGKMRFLREMSVVDSVGEYIALYDEFEGELTKTDALFDASRNRTLRDDQLRLRMLAKQGTHENPSDAEDVPRSPDGRNH
jgi:hypothetical protein